MEALIRETPTTPNGLLVAKGVPVPPPTPPTSLHPPVLLQLAPPTLTSALVLAIAEKDRAKEMRFVSEFLSSSALLRLFGLQK